MTVTDAKAPDIKVARALRLPKGSIVVADRAYMDFDWINSLILQGVFLVTRLKRRIKYRVVERREANLRQGVTSARMHAVIQATRNRIAQDGRRAK